VSNPDQAAPLRRAQIDAPIELSVEELDAEAAPTFLENVDTIVREDRLDESFVDAVCAPPRSSRTAG
jgi:hypothetical protein